MGGREETAKKKEKKRKVKAAHFSECVDVVRLTSRQTKKLVSPWRVQSAVNEARREQSKCRNELVLPCCSLFAMTNLGSFGSRIAVSRSCRKAKPQVFEVKRAVTLQAVYNQRHGLALGSCAAAGLGYHTDHQASRYQEGPRTAASILYPSIGRHDYSLRQSAVVSTRVTLLLCCCPISDRGTARRACPTHLATYEKRIFIRSLRCLFSFCSWGSWREKSHPTSGGGSVG